jgi:hypothetical protein
MCRKKLVLLNHYLGGFHNDKHGVAFVEFQLVGAAPCNGALNEIVTHPDDHMGNDITQLDLFDSSAQLVPG